MTADIAITENTGIRLLTPEELDRVSGGVLPIVLLATALYGHATATSLIGWALSSVSVIGGTYYAMKYLDSYGS